MGADAAELLGGALELSTWNARATHMAALRGFMQLRRREFPLREQDLVAFLGYLYRCLVTKRGPQLRAVSVPGYLSGIRNVHAALGLGALPTEGESLLLAAAVTGYRKAADATVPPTKARTGIPVHVLYRIMQLARAPHASLSVQRDAALLITAVVFGLRPAGVEGLMPAHVIDLSPERCHLVISTLKGKTVAQAARRGARTFNAPSPVRGKPITVLEVLTAWRDLRRRDAVRWFDAPGLPRPSLDDAVRSLTRAAGYAPPNGGTVSGHSPRITAFSQSVMLDWSPVRLKVRFDWRSVADMADVYLDHSVRTSAASRIFFDPALPEPPCDEPPQLGRPDQSAARVDSAPPPQARPPALAVDDAGLPPPAAESPALGAHDRAAPDDW